MIIDCKSFISSTRLELSKRVKEFYQEVGRSPVLSILRVTGDAASEVYVRNKVKLSEELGITCCVTEFASTVEQQVIADTIQHMNVDNQIDGIMLQLPIPDSLDCNYLINLISPEKDVDGLTLSNQGRLFAGLPGLFPCTPSGIIALLKHIHGDLSGKHAVVIGRSLIVGKPMAQLLLQENCTVTIIHSRSIDAAEISCRADIIVAAVGKPKFIGSQWVKPNATVIDVGINRIIIDGKHKLVGDVDFEKVRDIAGYITPVPGGVGPITVTFLMQNTIKAAYARAIIKDKKNDEKGYCR